MSYTTVFATPKPASIFGVVSDAVTGELLAGAAISLAERGDTAVSDFNGAYRLFALPDGTYTLTASLPAAGDRYGAATATVIVSAASGASIVNAALPPTAVTGAIQGTSGGAATNLPLALVRLQGSDDQAYTDANGRYLLDAVEPGTRTLEVSARGFVTQTATAAIVRGATSNVNVTLNPS
ncbi:MAG TPA: carboxypeptidase regulatory-like domain-containing protein [Polyangia bacterium]|nr:carboxypeptidase regulatory-like domain-containing protein [Polyangia bacterium]